MKTLILVLVSLVAGRLFAATTDKNNETAGASTAAKAGAASARDTKRAPANASANGSEALDTDSALSQLQSALENADAGSDD